MTNQNSTKEKIETILNTINESKYITPSSQPIKITHHKFRTLKLKDESYIGELHKIYMTKKQKN